MLRVIPSFNPSYRFQPVLSELSRAVQIDAPSIVVVTFNNWRVLEEDDDCALEALLEMEILARDTRLASYQELIRRRALLRSLTYFAFDALDPELRDYKRNSPLANTDTLYRMLRWMRSEPLTEIIPFHSSIVR